MQSLGCLKGNNMRRPTLILAFLILTAVGLIVVRAAVSNAISPNGTVLAKISEEREFYKKENKALREDLFAKTSLNSISSEAARFGFVERKNSFVLTKPLPIALKR